MFYKAFLSPKPGFTVLELIIVIALLGVLAVLSVPFLYSWQISTQMDVTGDQIISSLRRAQGMAIAGVDDSEWGVYFFNDRLIIFKGTDFLARDLQYDEVLNFSENIIVINNFSDQQYFYKAIGRPRASGSITLTDATGKISKVTISEVGVIELAD